MVCPFPFTLKEVHGEFPRNEASGRSTRPRLTESKRRDRTAFAKCRGSRQNPALEFETPSMRKPVILTLDDDASVVRAVERDLRREYGTEGGRP